MAPPKQSFQTELPTSRLSVPPPWRKDATAIQLVGPGQGLFRLSVPVGGVLVIVNSNHSSKAFVVWRALSSGRWGTFLATSLRGQFA